MYGKYKSKKSKSAKPKTTKPKATRSSRTRRQIRKYGRSNMLVPKPSVSIQRGYLPIQKEGYFKFPYTESFAITASGTAGTAVVNYQYRITGPRDPRYNLGGYQPDQWDQISIFYERYWVLGAYITVTFSNPDHDGLLVGFRMRATTDATATHGLYIEDVRSARDTRTGWIMNTDKQYKTFSGYVKPWDLLGTTRAQYMNLVYSSQISTVPNPDILIEPFALHTVAEENCTVRCTIKIQYYVHMTNGQTKFDDKSIAP